MKWLKKYEIGHETIDLQHRVFFNIINAIEEAEAEGTSRGRVRHLTRELVKYAEFHFLSEENMMVEIGYPAFEEHRNLHKSLTQNLKKHIIQFEAKKNKPEEFIAFLREWFSEHTLIEDRQLAKHLVKLMK